MLSQADNERLTRVGPGTPAGEWLRRDEMGAINYDVNKRGRFLDIGMPPERGLYGEETAQKIDSEIKRILNDAHNTARRILTEQRHKLESVTHRLLEIEVMEGDELRLMLSDTASA